MRLSISLSDRLSVTCQYCIKTVKHSKISLKFEWGLPQRSAKYRWGRLKSSTFDKLLTIAQVPVQDRCIVSIRLEYDVVCALSNGDIAGDFGLP